LEVFLEPDLVRHIIKLGTFVRYETDLYGSTAGSELQDQGSRIRPASVDEFADVLQFDRASSIRKSGARCIFPRRDMSCNIRENLFGGVWTRNRRDDLTTVESLPETNSVDRVWAKIIGPLGIWKQPTVNLIELLILFSRLGLYLNSWWELKIRGEIFDVGGHITRPAEDPGTFAVTDQQHRLQRLSACPEYAGWNNEMMGSVLCKTERSLELSPIQVGAAGGTEHSGAEASATGGLSCPEVGAWVGVKSRTTRHITLDAGRSETPNV
jgi:hypothetical protein